MSNPKKQHLVPQLYLKNFAFENKAEHKLYVLDKTKNKIFKANIKDIAAERNFYTLNNLEDKYIWENFYANELEPIMGAILQDLIKKSNLCVFHNKNQFLDDNLKSNISFIIIFQMLRSHHTRKYGKKLFDELAPKILADTKEKFMGKVNKETDRKLESFEFTEDMFKSILKDVTLDEDRIYQFANVLYNRSWVLFKITDSTEFITSDDPVLIMNMDTLNITPFRNGIAENSTVIYYPISSKLIIALYSPSVYLGRIQGYENSLSYIDFNNAKKFIENMNRKQFEHCYRQVFSYSECTLKSLKLSIQKDRF